MTDEKKSGTYLTSRKSKPKYKIKETGQSDNLAVIISKSEGPPQRSSISREIAESPQESSTKTLNAFQRSNKSIES